MKRQIFLLTLSCHYHGRIVAKSHKKVTSFHRISMEIQAHKEFIFCETYDIKTNSFVNQKHRIVYQLLTNLSYSTYFREYENVS